MSCGSNKIMYRYECTCCGEPWSNGTILGVRVHRRHCTICNVGEPVMMEHCLPYPKLLDMEIEKHQHAICGQCGGPDGYHSNGCPEFRVQMRMNENARKQPSEAVDKSDPLDQFSNVRVDWVKEVARMYRHLDELDRRQAQRVEKILSRLPRGGTIEFRRYKKLPPSTGSVIDGSWDVTADDDNWSGRNEKMRCRTCMWFVGKATLNPGPMHPQLFGRCRRHAPTLSGWPAVYGNDWCGDHKLDEAKA